MPVRHAPFWLDRAARGRRPAHPPFRGHAEPAVAIVGGGLTGCASAFAFAAAGVKVVLLEAETVGAAATAGSAGLMRPDFNVPFAEAASRHGLRTARLMWQAMRRAGQDFQAALRRLEARCDLSPAEFLQIARRDPDASKQLRREYQARRDAGFDHTWMTPAALGRDSALETGGGIRTRGAQFDPYRACLALAAAAVERGAVIHEHSRVRRVRAGRRQVEIGLERGDLRADAVVIATAAPLQDLRALRRHLDARHRYAVVTEPVPAAVRRAVGSRSAVLRDGALPPHTLRWLRDDRVLFAGADQPEVPVRLLEKTIVQRTGQLMYELSVLYPAISGLRPEWSWQSTLYETADGLPFAGRHRNFPRHLFAIGGASDNATFAWLAARILLRQFKGESEKADELFGFTRVL